VATTYTPIYRMAQMQPLDPSVRNSWGPIADAAWLVAEQGASGNTPIALSGPTQTLSTANNAPDQGRLAMWNFTGALGSNCAVTVPPVARVGWARNSTTGNHNVILTTGAGRTVTLLPGITQFYTCDGSNIDALTPAFAGPLSATTGTFSGHITGASGLSITSGGMSVTGATTITGTLQATSTLTGSVVVSVGQSSIVSGGWSYSATGPGAFPPTTVFYGVISNNTNMLAVSFLAVSDVRLKFDIEDISDAEAERWVKTSRPVTYRKLPSYGADPATAQTEAGFIAQDQVKAGYGRYVATAESLGMPELIDGDLHCRADAMLTLPMQYQVAYLTRALQMALARIEALEARTP